MSEVGSSIAQATAAIQQGGVVIYPTEGIYGIGCDFRNEQSVLKILKLKKRSVSKGLVLIASHIQQILPLILPEERAHLARALKSWPGHHTWIFPASKLTPKWITGDHDTVAVRVTEHPTAQALCDACGHALVSTSANISGHHTPENIPAIQHMWLDQIDYYLDLPLGSATKPSSIRLASSGKILR